MRDFRQDFQPFAPTIYLDCAYQGPFPRLAEERVQRAIQTKCHPDRLNPAEYFELPERVRNRFGRLIGADASEIALTNSATHGIGIVAAGLGLEAGDEVVITSRNFPSNLFTWLHLRRLGVRVHVIKPASHHVTPEEVLPVLNSRTRILAVDWVSYTSGARIDLAAFGDLAHRHGALLVVDGTQGVGALPLNVHDVPVDVLAVAAYKWLLGPYGTGFAYLRMDIQNWLDLPVVNWLTVEGSEDFDALPTDQFTLPRAAKIFDVPETSNFINLSALDASLEYVGRAGVSTVNEHCARLLDRLGEGLKRRGYRLSDAARPEHCSTILGFQADSLDATAELHRKLRASQVAVSLRHGMIRVSPYLYNHEDDVDRLLEVVG
jgi:cysteine desulfurase/selenocysteine lyase